MKIAYILDVFPHGQTHIVNELIALEKHGLDVHILACCPSDHNDVVRVSYKTPFPVTYLSTKKYDYGWLSFLKDNSIFFLDKPAKYTANACLSLRWAGANFKQAARWGRVLAEIKPDLVYVNWSWATCGSVMYACRIMGIPFAFSVQGTDIRPPSKNFSLRSKTAKLIITPSLGYQDALKNLLSVPEHKIKVVPHAMVFEELRSLPLPRAAITDCFRILCLSTLRSVKRLVDLIDVCHILNQKKIPVECRIFGEGPDRQLLTEHIQKQDLGNIVKLLGHRPQEQLADQFQWCDIYAHTSESESFCFAVVEGQAAGRPVVAADGFGGIRQSVRPDETALLVPPRNPEAMAEKIIFLYENPELRIKMAKAGREFVWKEFSFDTFQNKFIAALSECVK